MRPSYGDFILEQERKERRKRNTIIAIVILVLLVIGLAVGFIFVWKNGYITLPGKETMAEADNVQQQEEEIAYTQEELDAQVAVAVETARAEATASALSDLKAYLASGKSAVEAFRMVYKDDLVIAANGQYHFIPIRDDLKQNPYSTENLNILENGEIQYMQDGQVTSYKGIDVSKFQERIDWQKVAEDGVQFAFIRVGNRGYGSGTIMEDSSFKRNIQGAIDAGIKVGVYFFTQALTEAEVLEEANFVLEQIAPYQVECPIVFDVEMVAGDEGRMDALTAEERTHLTKVFCDTIQNAGYKTMIYMNLEMATIGLNFEELEAYDKWFAYYNPDMYFPYEFKVWQYSESGRVSGVNGQVDMNICFEPIWE